MHLGLSEKHYPKEDVEIKEVKLCRLTYNNPKKALLIYSLVAGENFAPDYIKINPNGTVPSLLASSEDKPLTDSRDILKFLDHHSVSPGAPHLTPSDASTALVMNKLIDLVHSEEMDTNTILLGARNEAELSTKKSGMFNDFITNRQAALEKYHSAEPQNTFYENKLKQNGVLYHLYSTKSSDLDKSAFFQDTEAKCKKLAKALGDLDAQIRLPYAAGDQVTLADLHMIPWVSHALLGAGTTDPADFSKLNEYVRKSVPEFEIGEKTRTWWNNFRERESFKEVFKKLR